MPGTDLPGRARRRGSAGGGVRIVRSGVPPWLAWQLLLPLAVFVAANFVLLQLGGDRWIAGHLYLWEGGRWALKDAFVTSTLVYEAGMRLSVLAWLGVVAFAAATVCRPACRSWRLPLLYLALAGLPSPSDRTWMTSFTPVACTWAL